MAVVKEDFVYCSDMPYNQNNSVFYGVSGGDWYSYFWNPIEPKKEWKEAFIHLTPLQTSNILIHCNSLNKANPVQSPFEIVEDKLIMHYMDMKDDVFYPIEYDNEELLITKNKEGQIRIYEVIEDE